MLLLLSSWSTCQSWNCSCCERSTENVFLSFWITPLVTVLLFIGLLARKLQSSSYLVSVCTVGTTWKHKNIIISSIPIQSRRIDPWIRGFVVIVARGAVRCGWTSWATVIDSDASGDLFEEVVLVGGLQQSWWIDAGDMLVVGGRLLGFCLFCMVLEVLFV